MNEHIIFIFIVVFVALIFWHFERRYDTLREKCHRCIIRLDQLDREILTLKSHQILNTDNQKYSKEGNLLPIFNYKEPDLG